MNFINICVECSKPTRWTCPYDRRPLCENCKIDHVLGHSASDIGINSLHLIYLPA